MIVGEKCRHRGQFRPDHCAELSDRLCAMVGEEVIPAASIVSKIALLMGGA